MFTALFPLLAKEAIAGRRKLLELLLIVGLPLSIRCNLGGEFIADVIKYLCRWLKVPLDYGQRTTHQHRGQSKGLGVGYRRFLPRCAPLGLSDGTTLFLWQHGFNA